MLALLIPEVGESGVGIPDRLRLWTLIFLKNGLMESSGHHATSRRTINVTNGLVLEFEVFVFRDVSLHVEKR